MLMNADNGDCNASDDNVDGDNNGNDDDDVVDDDDHVDAFGLKPQMMIYVFDCFNEQRFLFMLKTQTTLSRFPCMVSCLFMHA